jgi:hypothetical protein
MASWPAFRVGQVSRQDASGSVSGDAGGSGVARGPPANSARMELAGRGVDFNGLALDAHWNPNALVSRKRRLPCLPIPLTPKRIRHWRNSISSQ